MMLSKSQMEISYTNIKAYCDIHCCGDFMAGPWFKEHASFRSWVFPLG